MNDLNEAFLWAAYEDVFIVFPLLCWPGKVSKSTMGDNMMYFWLCKPEQFELYVQSLSLLFGLETYWTSFFFSL